MNYNIEQEQEEDGRWIVEVPELPGVLAYGQSIEEATIKVEILALRGIAKRLENNESHPISIDISISNAA